MNEFTRRRLLSLVGASATAGCGSVVGGDGREPYDAPDVDESNPPTHGRPTTSDDAGTSEEGETDDGPAGLVDAAVVALETQDRTVALTTPPVGEYGVDVQCLWRRTATSDHPATLQVSVTNATDAETTVPVDDVPPLGGVEFDAESAAPWYLVPVTAHDLSDDGATLARTDGRWYLRRRPDDFPERVALDPAETVTGVLALVGGPDAGRLPTGRFTLGGHVDPSVAVWQTSAPGPDERSRFAMHDFVSLPGDFEWFHAAGIERPVFLRPSAERTDLAADLSFALVNHSRDAVTGNPYDWTLFKYHDGDWYDVAPRAIPVPLGAIPPGGVERYRFHLTHGESDRRDGTRGVGFLGGGRYALAVRMAREDEAAGHAALFDVDAPRRTVEPTDDVAATRADGTVTVEPESEPDDPVTLSLTKSGSARETRIAEQVMRLRGLRNTLAFVGPDVRRVVTHTTEDVADRVLGAGEARTFAFRGQAYRVTRVTE